MNNFIPLQIIEPFRDQYQREKRKLRISVTDRCNFKCVYCMPEHPKWVEQHQLLSFDHLYLFCRFMVERGIESIRITGGEPLMRQGVVSFVCQLQELKKLGLKTISMTTNGHYLEKHAFLLKQAGLDNINISLDSLDESQFLAMTKKRLAPVLLGIDAAKKAGLNLKINSVLMNKINENQIIPLAHWSIEHEIPVRFIEFMPLDGDATWSASSVVKEQDILTTLAKVFKLTQKTSTSSNPAREYYINDHPIGIISTISHSFCGTCDRLRLNAKGDFYNCLFATTGLNIKNEIQNLAHCDLPHSRLLEQKIATYVWHKDKGYDAIQAKRESTTRTISMHMIGG